MTSPSKTSPSSSSVLGCLMLRAWSAHFLLRDATEIYFTHTLRRLSPMPILRVTAHVNGVYIDRPEAVKSSHCVLPSPWSFSASRRYQLVIKKMPKPSQIPSKTSSECNRSIKKPLAKRSIQYYVLPSG